MKTKIIIDSTTDVAKEIREEFCIVPLTIRFGEDDFIDGVTITHKKFYEMLVESDEIPVTSQATPDAFERAIGECVRNGEKAVVITVASKLSGTYQSAMIAASEYPGEVFVVDSKTVAIGAGILAELALDMAKRGMGAEEIAKRIEKERENVCLIAMLDTLEYLKKGGRISKTVAFAGGLLQIKPVVCVRDGVIEMLGKARGSKQGNNLLIKEIEAAGGVDFSKPLLLGYTGLSDILLQKYIEDSSHIWEGNVSGLRSEIIGSAIGTHAGPGAVAAAFFKKCDK